MKVKFIFDTENENDAEDLKVFQRAQDMRYVISCFESDRRYKHADQGEQWWEGYNEARRIFFEYCEQIGLNVGDL